jgi:hypothetical protein
MYFYSRCKCHRENYEASTRMNNETKYKISIMKIMFIRRMWTAVTQLKIMPYKIHIYANNK